MIRLNGVVIVAVVALLAACAVGPDYRVPEVFVTNVYMEKP